MMQPKPCDSCDIIDWCGPDEKCMDLLIYEKELKKMAETKKKNYVWDNKAFNLAGKEVTITAVYKTTAKNGNEYFNFYIQGDDENIYCTKWKKFFYVKPGDKFNVSMSTYNNLPAAVWDIVK